MLRALEQQDLEQAQVYFQEALEKDSDEELLGLAEYLESIGFLSEAQTIYEGLINRFPEVAIRLANIAMEDGKVELAFAYLDQIDENSPYYVEALVSQADFYQLEGLTDVAKEKLLLACQLSNDPLLRFGLAELELELENFQAAIKEYARLDNRAIYHDTGVSTYQRIGFAYANMGKFEVAIEFLEKAIELEYNDQSLFELATLLFEQEHYQRATLYFKQLETLNPDFEGYQSLYAQSLHAEHDVRAALTIVQKALTRNEMDVSLLLLASQYAYELNDSPLAEVYLLKAKVWAEDLEEINLRLSSMFLEQNRYEDLIALDSPEIENVLTRWQIAKGYQFLEAEEALLKYGELHDDLKDNPEFLKEYSLLLREKGEFDTAKQVLRRYLDYTPDDIDMLELFQSFED